MGGSLECTLAGTGTYNRQQRRWDVYIPAGVTLASGRGRTLGDTISWGGLIYTDTHGGYTLFRTNGKHIRVSGLRFRGEFRDYRTHIIPDTFDPGDGLKFFQIRHDSCEIDNCEFCGFGNFAVTCSDEDGFFYAHHSYFRNTMMCVHCL